MNTKKLSLETCAELWKAALAKIEAAPRTEGAELYEAYDSQRKAISLIRINGYTLVQINSVIFRK